MLDHTGVCVIDYEASKKFYQQALAPLGYTLLAEIPDPQSGKMVAAGLGVAPKADFWLEGRGAANEPPLHVAFRADTRALVDAFYKAALAAGGRDNGAPGVRPHYHPDYYGAFVLDPNGHNIEAVCHQPA